MCQHPAITNAMRYGAEPPMIRCDLCAQEADPPRMLKKTVCCDTCLNRLLDDLSYDLADFLFFRGIRTDEADCKEFLERCYHQSQGRWSAG